MQHQPGSSRDCQRTNFAVDARSDDLLKNSCSAANSGINPIIEYAVIDTSWKLIAAQGVPVLLPVDRKNLFLGCLPYV
jgi:hypothetical protein